MSEPKSATASSTEGGEPLEPSSNDVGERDHGVLDGEHLERPEDRGIRNLVPETKVEQKVEESFQPNKFRGTDATQDAYKRGADAIAEMRDDGDLPFVASPTAKLPERKQL